MSAPLHVAVAIVGFRNPDDVARCLAALGRSTYADFEVIICENGGEHSHRRLVEAIPQRLAGGQIVRAIAAPGNLGYAGGVNLCLATTPTADAWWVLNPDTEPHPQALAALVARLQRGDCDLVGGLVHFPDGTVESWGSRWLPLAARTISMGYGQPLGTPIDAAEVEATASYFSGASFMVSARFVREVGPMTDGYFLYCEEVEWCLRGTQRGMRLGLAPDALVLHYQGTTTGSVEDFRQRPKMPVYLDERNKLLVTRDRYARYLPIAMLATLALIVARFGKRRAWKQLGFALQGWSAGIRNERGVPSWLKV